MKKKIRAIMICFLFLGIPAFLTIMTPARAQITWEPPLQITMTDLEDDKAAIAYDPSQSCLIHATWVRQTNNSDYNSTEIMYANNQNWNDQIQITNDNFWDDAPSIDVDASGVVHLLWVKSYGLDKPAVQYVNSTNWTAIVNITVATWPSYRTVSIVVEKTTASPHMVWISAAPGTSKIYYRKGITGPTLVAVDTPGWSEGVSIDLDQGNNVHLVWQEYVTGPGYQVRYTNSTIWPATSSMNYVNISSPSTPDCQFPDIDVDQWNRSHISFVKINSGLDTLYYTRGNFQNDGFLPLEKVANMSGLYTNIKVNSIFNPFIIFGNNSHIYVANANSSWTPIDISQNSYYNIISSSYCKALDIDNSDNLAVAYTTILSGNYEIFLVTTCPSGGDGSEFKWIILLIIIISVVSVAVVFLFLWKKGSKGSNL